MLLKEDTFVKHEQKDQKNSLLITFNIKINYMWFTII